MPSNESSTKKCRECGQIGHVSSDCKNGKVGCLHLFGVKIYPTDANNQCEGDDDDNRQPVGCSIRGSKSTEILKRNDSENSLVTMDRECVSDHEQDKKKGLPWTEDEHRSFLTGLEELGKGNWRAISNTYVPTRTPTQVASHAQKYFIRMNATNKKRKRRSSLFDMSYNPEQQHENHVLQIAYQNKHNPMNNCVLHESRIQLDRWTEALAVANEERRRKKEQEVENTND